jgi:hypothetical protein
MTNIDLLEKRVAALMRQIGTEVSKARHSRHTTIEEHFSDDPALGSDDDYQDVSNTSMDASDDSNGVDENDDTTLDDGEDEDDGITKLGSGGRLVYPHAEAAGYQQSRSAADRPGSLKHTTAPAYPHATGVTAAVVPAGRHAFDDRVDQIKDRDSVTKQVALQRARIEFPDDYENFQAFYAGTSTSEQRARRDGYGVNVGKSAPDLVEIEMRKGCSREIALQRLAQQFGFRAFDNPDRLTKRRADLTYTFLKRCDEIMDQDGVSATEATRRARLEDPRLFATMQSVG